MNLHEDLGPVAKERFFTETEIRKRARQMARGIANEERQGPRYWASRAVRMGEAKEGRSKKARRA